MIPDDDGEPIDPKIIAILILAIVVWVASTPQDRPTSGQKEATLQLAPEWP